MKETESINSVIEIQETIVYNHNTHEKQHHTELVPVLAYKWSPIYHKASSAVLLEPSTNRK